MANFATHLAVGIIGSGALATLTQASGMVPQTDIVTLACAGAIGAILPDIDLGKQRWQPGPAIELPTFDRTGQIRTKPVPH